MVSISSLNYCKNLKIFLFQILRTIVFDLNVASKPISKKLAMINFEFRWSGRLCLAFPENGFNFITQKFEKTEECPF